DRISLAILVDQSRATHVPSIPAVCSFALANGDEACHTELAQYYLGAYLPQEGPAGSNASSNLNGYRLYGQLNSLQQDALRAGSPVPFASLPDPAKGTLFRLLFGVDDQPNAGQIPSFVPRRDEDKENPDAPSIDVTVQLPNGLPMDGF